MTLVIVIGFVIDAGVTTAYAPDTTESMKHSRYAVSRTAIVAGFNAPRFVIALLVVKGK